MLKFQFKELDYGPFLEVRAETPRVELHRWMGQDEMHPFWGSYCTARAPHRDKEDADARGYEFFEVTEDTMVMEEVVVDNQVTRAIIGAIENIGDVEVGNTLRSAYLSNLIDILFNRLWD